MRLNAKEMVRVAKANLRRVETLQLMKLGRYATIEGKKAEDAMTPLTSNESPTSPDQGVNVGNILREDSPHQMAGDVFVLASTSTHVADLTSSSKNKKNKKAPRVKMVANKKRLVKRTYKYKLPFFEGCAKQFKRITKPERLVADYALDVNGVERYFGS